MGIFGCDPRKYFSGRAPLELAASGGVMPEGGAAYRCNMVSLGGDVNVPFEERVMISHSAGSIEGEESDELIGWLFEQPEFAALAEAAKLTVRPARPSGTLRCRRTRTSRASCWPRRTTI